MGYLLRGEESVAAAMGADAPDLAG